MKEKIVKRIINLLIILIFFIKLIFQIIKLFNYLKKIDFTKFTLEKEIILILLNKHLKKGNIFIK